MVTRPVSPPWDEGSRNTAWQIARHAKNHSFCLLTDSSDHETPAIDSVKWEHIYTDRRLLISQKLRLLWYLIHRKPTADIYHFLFVPTLETSWGFSRIVRWQRKRSIQTVPSLYRSGLSSAEANALLFADRVVTISDWTTRELRSLGLHNVVRIRLGVDLDVFRPARDREDPRRRFGLPSNAPIALFSGELTRLGSLDMLLSIIPGVLADNNALHFVIACPARSSADIESRERAKQAVHNAGLDTNVHFLGVVHDFCELLGVADMLLYPVSTMLGKIDTPLTVLEAMATELPVILMDVPPLNEVLSVEAGIVVPPGDSKAFVQAVLDLADHEEWRREMGARARRVIEDRYSLRKMVWAYEELYDELS